MKRRRSTARESEVKRCALSCSFLLVLLAFSVGGADEASKDERPLEAADFEHWAFRSLQRPAVPAVANVAWPRDAVDRFVLSRVEEAELRPAPEADPVTLIRRLTFDLTGLPPTPEAVDAFLADDRPDAYECLVDRLLASPAHGERWGRHWLDLARFAETDGFEQDHKRPNAWRYRDWVVDALNEDLPYDEFVRLQIAGDELRPGDPAAGVATGFTLCGPDMPDINSQVERRHVFLNDVTSTVGSVFLGLQLRCAQCHDHKFDPVSQADFYRLRACFDNVDIFRDHPIPTPADRERYERDLAALANERREVEQAIARLQKGAAGEEKLETFKKQLAALKKRKVTPMPAGRVFRERSSPAPKSHLMVRGRFDQAGPRVDPGFPRVANRDGNAVRRPDDGSSRGIRTALANWLTRVDHPLTLRVISNRLWQHHFGEGIVRTPSDFGTRGELPDHPALLDWLAVELTRGGWSLKRVHRRLVTSAVYRQASRLSDASEASAREPWNRAGEKDPGNRLLARGPRRRLEAEAIRDSLLAVAGGLSQRRGGRGVMAPLPREIRKTIRKDHWSVDPDPEEHRRRSLYLFVRRNLRYPFLAVFDSPDTNQSCSRRSRTTIAPQSLALLNSELSMECARGLAGRLASEADSADRAARVRRAYRLVLGREPERKERELALDFVEALGRKLREERRSADDLTLPAPWPASADPHEGAAWTAFCLALINLNEFLYID